MTLFISGAFGLAAGGSLDFLTLASLIAVVGIGAGGTSVQFHDESCIELCWRQHARGLGRILG